MPRDLPPTRKWLSLKETAEHLGFSDRTIRTYIRRGQLKAYKPPTGRVIRIELAEVERFMRKRAVPAGAQEVPETFLP